ncbi:MAG: S4 domain-containing protein [Candidatus Ozemobacteraceae bacterium]
MRLDKFLQITGLIKRRVLANEACKRGLIKVNGIVAKPTRDVAMGDLIELDLPRRDTAVRLLKDLTGHTLPRSKRADAFETVRDIARTAADDPLFPWNDDEETGS